MPDINSSPNWHSGLKTLPKSNYAHSPESVTQNVHKPGPPERWDIEAKKTLKRSKSVPATLDHGHAEHWAGGLKTLEHSHLSKPVEKDHPVVAATEDWEHSSTLHKTLETEPVPERFQTGQSAWSTENHKVLPPHEAHPPTSMRHPRYDSHRTPDRWLETETVPTKEWAAGQKVVPPARRPKFYMPEPPVQYRAERVPHTPEVPPDSTWSSENLKVLDEAERRKKPVRTRRIADDWEAGSKVVPEADVLARDRYFRKVHHPFTWLDESFKALPKEKSHRPNVYRFHVENTGWDSALYKTLEPAEKAPSVYGPRARLNYASNYDWYVDGKVIPSSEQRINPHNQRQYVVTGTGWDSGLKALPWEEAHAPSSPGKAHSRPQWEASKDHWDVDNHKVLPWGETHTASHAAYSNRFIHQGRADDMAKFHARLCQHDSRYAAY
eukprot:EG_transcript_8857